MKQAFW